jgi:hypothetical protein
LYGAPESEAWAFALVAEIAAAAHAQGAARLLVVQSPGWPNFAALQSNVVKLPLLTVADASAAQERYLSGDALLWLGAPHEGAALLAGVRARDPNALFWMGPQGGDPVFYAHAEIAAPVFWAIWTDGAYNHALQADNSLSPSAYLVYRAAQAAIAEIEGRQPTGERAWRVVFFRLDAAGANIAWAPE